MDFRQALANLRKANAPIAVREIMKPPKGEDGLFVQPRDVSPKREVMENHNRMRFANHYGYADMYTGNTRTYDEEGRYNCGRCNLVDGGYCLMVNAGKEGTQLEVDEDAGSCGEWENECAGDPEIALNHKTPQEALYAIAANGKTWGCRVCPFASAAYTPDSRDRDLYCGKGDFRTYGTACCEINGAPTKKGT